MYVIHACITIQIIVEIKAIIVKKNIYIFELRKKKQKKSLHTSQVAHQPGGGEGEGGGGTPSYWQYSYVQPQTIGVFSSIGYT